MSKTQKILAGALGLATVVSLVSTAAVLTASAQTSSYNFTQNLTVGSSGPDVTALQQLLASKGFFTVTPTGYFGSITKAAVAAWQASAGLPSTGFFGPLSRAAVNSMAMTSTSNVPGCAAGAMFSSTTGAPCTSSMSTVPGCAAGAMFSSTTGAPCTTTVTPVTTPVTGGACPAGYTCSPVTSTNSSSQEGTLNLTLAGTPSNQTNIQTDIDVPVWGLQAQAQIGDVTVQRIDLDIADSVQASPSYIENPGNFINAIQLVDQSTGTVLGTWNVNSSNFTEGTTSSDYYIRLSGFAWSIPNGQTKTLQVNISTNAGIDTARNLTLVGYGTTGLQTLSAGVVDYYNISGTSFQRTQQFTKPGNTTVTFGVDASNPLSSSFYSDPNNGAQNVPVFVFNVQATNANANINSVTITAVKNSATGDAQDASTVTLISNGQTIASQSIPAGNGSTVVFNNIQGFTIPSGTTEPITVEVNVPSFTNTIGGVGTTTVNLELTGITYQSTTGQVYTTSPNIDGNNQYFFEGTPQFAFVSGSAGPANNNQNGKTVSTSGTLTFTTTPKNGQMVQPQASDFLIGVGTSLAAAKTALVPVASTSISSITPQPSSATSPLSQGQTYTIQLSAQANGLAGGGNPLMTGSGNYQFYLIAASSTVYTPNGGSVSTVQTWGLDNFKSGSVSVAE